MALVRQAWNSFHETLDRYADKRTTNWFLMSSPFYTAAICLSYVYIVKVLGPKFMENRKPLELRRVLIAYNLFQVVFSAWLFYECLMGGWWGEYSLRCQPVDYSESPSATRIGISGWFTGRYSLRCQPVDYTSHSTAIRMTHASWWYYFSKFTEFFDTFFFVLRKKTQHVSTLHVIHHGIMPFSVWFGVKFTPGGHSTFFGLLNTFVHIIMYSYYLLAALGPQVQKYLWWKKYITGLQMAQFVAIMVHAFQLLFTECDYPRAFVWWIGMHAVMFWFLFKEFYDQSYRKPREKAAAKRAADAEAKKNEEAATNGQVKNQNGVKNGTAALLTSKARASDYYIPAGDLQYRSGSAK